MKTYIYNFMQPLFMRMPRGSFDWPPGSTQIHPRTLVHTRGKFLRRLWGKVNFLLIKYLESFLVNISVF